MRKFITSVLLLTTVLIAATARADDYFTIDLALTETEYDGALLGPVYQPRTHRFDSSPRLAAAPNLDKRGYEGRVTYWFDPRDYAPFTAVWLEREDHGLDASWKVGVTLTLGKRSYK